MPFVLTTEIENVLKPTSASLSNRAKSSFNILTKSWAEYVDEIAVNPTISAYKILKRNQRKVQQKKYLTLVQL